MIEHAIAKEMGAYSSRIGMLELRNLFIMEQIRSLVYNVLRNLPRLTDEEVLTDEQVDDIMQGSKYTAQRNIAEVAPELTPYLQAFETWLRSPMSSTNDGNRESQLHPQWGKS